MNGLTLSVGLQNYHPPLMSDTWKKGEKLILWPLRNRSMPGACFVWMQQFWDLDGRADGVSHPFLHHQKPEEIFK